LAFHTNIENMAMPSWIQGYIYNSSVIISDVYVFYHLLGKGNKRMKLTDPEERVEHDDETDVHHDDNYNMVY
jgi:hypothetical protein